MSNKIIFDVGANDGTSCYYFSHDTNNTVYAFEPVPFSLNKLYKLQKENYIVIPKAVSGHNGKVKFNVGGEYNSGVGSIYSFNDGLEKTWPGYNIFFTSEEIEVDCITMESFIEENKITSVDFLHCDTQGSDLDVLRSFGKQISILKKGQIEVYGQNPAYKGAGNSLHQVQLFLEVNGFKVTRIESNDYLNNEFNMIFEKSTG